MGDISGHSSVRQALLEWSEGLARNPWLEALCLVLTRVTPRLIEQRTCVVDTNGQSLPLEPGFGSGWELLALSGGHPLTLIGEWDGYALTPLLVRAEERWIVL
jgi:hypothetical protein